jgi:hypothetical protein
MFYLSIMAPILLPTNKGGLFREVRDYTKEMVTELEVLGTSPALGRPVEKLLDNLGTTKDELIKIRRRAVDDDANEEDTDGGHTPEAFEGVLSLLFAAVSLVSSPLTDIFVCLLVTSSSPL